MGEFQSMAVMNFATIVAFVMVDAVSADTCSVHLAHYRMKTASAATACTCPGTTIATCPCTGICCEANPTMCAGSIGTSYTCANGTSATQPAKVGTTKELCCSATPAPTPAPTASPAPTAVMSYTCATFPGPATPAPAVGTASGAQQFVIEASVMLVAAMLTFSAV